VWIDLERPTEDELKKIAGEFPINKRIETELLSPTPAPIMVKDAGSGLLVLHFPTQGTKNGETKNQELDFVVGKNFIITVHYEVIAPLHQLKKLLETRSVVVQDEFITTDILLEIIFMHLYASVRDHVNHIVSRLEAVELEMFEGNGRKTVHSISNINREFLHLKSALANQEEPLHRFLEMLEQHKMFGDSFGERVEHIIAEQAQVMRFVETHHAIALELRETNIALLELRQNEIMKILTIVIFGVELITLAFSLHLLF
jgi:magnesium transporter